MNYFLTKDTHSGKSLLDNDVLPLVPLKDRCGTTDLADPKLENMCYCMQKTDDGVSKLIIFSEMHTITKQYY